MREGWAVRCWAPPGAGKVRESESTETLVSTCWEQFAALLPAFSDHRPPLQEAWDGGTFQRFRSSDALPPRHSPETVCLKAPSAPFFIPGQLPKEAPGQGVLRVRTVGDAVGLE